MDTEASETPKKRERDPDNQDSVSDHNDADGYSLKRTKLEGGDGDDDNGDNNHNKKSNGHAEVQIADQEKKEGPDQAVSMALNPPPQEEEERTTNKAPPSSKSLHPVAVALSPALTRSRASEKARTNGATVALERKGENVASPGEHGAADTSKRWRGEKNRKDKGRRIELEIGALPIQHLLLLSCCRCLSS
jgi:hypothetical protein